MCDYRVNRIWIAACLVLTLGTSAAAIASGHSALPGVTHAAAVHAAAAQPVPGDSYWN